MKRKKLTVLILFITIFSARAQHKPGEANFNNITVEKILFYIDSLKAVIIEDTVKFKRNDLIHIATGTHNSLNYSKLYLINGRYSYKLDIIPGKEVLEFVNEYLLPNKILKVMEISKADSQASFGLNGMYGAILVQLKKEVKFNPKVAGLKLKGRKVGDNFDQKLPNELFIRNL